MSALLLFGDTERRAALRRRNPRLHGLWDEGVDRRRYGLAEAERETVIRAVRELEDEAVVPGDFPLALGDRLRRDGIALTVDDDAVALRRRAKAAVELDGIRGAQRAAEAGMR